MSQRQPNHTQAAHKKGFSLLEVLLAVSVVVILMAIIIPAIGGAQNSAKRAKTRVLFSQWSAAIEQFRQEYGYYPVFVDWRVNGGSPAAGLNQQHIFHDTLSAVRRDGTAIVSASPSPAPEAQNPKRIRFCSFGTGDLTSSGLVQDGFGRTEIGVLVDRNLDGAIDLATNSDYATLPTLPLTIDGLAVPLPTGSRIRAGVAFYSAGDGQTPVTSW